MILLLCLSACGGRTWELLTDEEFAAYGEPLKSVLAEYVEAQRAYFAEHERYARHNELESPATVRLVPGGAEDLFATTGKGTTLWRKFLLFAEAQGKPMILPNAKTDDFTGEPVAAVAILDGFHQRYLASIGSS